MKATRAQLRALERENQKWPVELAPVPRDRWPTNPYVPQPMRVLRSRGFLVLEYFEGGPVVARLTVCRTRTAGDRWAPGITWDDLQRLKREAGYANRDAVEVYPRDVDLVNVENMRHLWVLEQPLAFAWRARPAAGGECR